MDKKSAFRGHFLVAKKIALGHTQLRKSRYESSRASLVAEASTALRSAPAEKGRSSPPPGRPSRFERSHPSRSAARAGKERRRQSTVRPCGGLAGYRKGQRPSPAQLRVEGTWSRVSASLFAEGVWRRGLGLTGRSASGVPSSVDVVGRQRVSGSLRRGASHRSKDDGPRVGVPGREVSSGTRPLDSPEGLRGRELEDVPASCDKLQRPSGGAWGWKARAEPKADPKWTTS